MSRSRQQKPRTQVKKNTRTEVIDQDTSTRSAAERKAIADQLTEDFDSVLDEIDEVLEENAQEFIQGYVQKGGQ